jgi:RNA polymerase sigma-70 factor (ECF subfamily)
MDYLTLSAIRRGDERALSRLITKYTPYVSTVIYNIIGSRMTAEDIEEVTSDVFLALWQNCEKADAVNLKAYLGSIARNKAKNKLRALLPVTPFENEWIQVPDDSMDDAILQAEQRQAVLNAISKMDKTDRAIFLGHYYHCRSVSELAKQLGMREGTVRQRLLRGRLRLREQLNEGGAQIGEINSGYSRQHTES